MNKSSGFTIVELLITIVVIAILASISTFAYNGLQTVLVTQNAILMLEFSKTA